MIVLYLKDGTFLQSIKGFPEVKEENNKLLFANGKVIINDLTKAEYREYPDQKYELPTEYDEESGTVIEVPVTIDELGLRGFTPEELIDKENLSRNLYTEIDNLKAKVTALKGK